MGTADLCDVHMPDPVDVMVPRKVAACDPNYFNDYGGKTRFHGKISTVLCFENSESIVLLPLPGNVSS